MGYLITNLWLCMALAALVGIATGYWMWRQPNEEDRFAGAGDGDAEPAARLAEDPVYTREEDSAGEETAPEPEDKPAEVPEEHVESEPAEDVASERPAAVSPFLDAPNGEPDNLTLIKGVGPKLSDMLHGLGIFHFAQIAGWGPEQVAEVDSQLGSFKGRVERDQWVDQARFLSTDDIAGFERQFGKVNRPI